MSDKFDFTTLKSGFVAPWPVMVPTPENGVFVPKKVMVLFRALLVDEIDAATKDSTNPLLDLAKQYFVGLAPEENATWSEALRDELLSSPRFFGALHPAFTAFNTGASSKN